jgi:hypothetical protein
MQVVVAKPYSGAEGKRIKRGTRFWVARISSEEAPGGTPTISWNRWMEMKRSGLAVEDVGTIPRASKEDRPTPARTPSKAPAGKAEEGRKTKVEPNPRNKTLSDHKAAAPGGRPGKTAQPSSSQVGPQTGASTLKQRGNRRGQRSGGLPSTTPGDSSPGLTPSTDVTLDGGGTTVSPATSEVID